MLKQQRKIKLPNLKSSESEEDLKAIVFGGSGFLGSHVADALTVKGHEVTIYDFKPSPFINAKQKMLLGDIQDGEAVHKACEDQDYIYNFAGIADLDDARTKPLHTVQLNIAGNINIMEAAVRANAKRFIYASTIYVYSQKGGFYRCSKQASELYIEEYNRRYGLGFTILRYGTLYGPRANNKNSIYRYLEQALAENKIDCKGSGDEIREYIYVKDAARLSEKILEDEYLNQYIIITGHHPMKFKDMLLMIREILGRDIRMLYDDRENPDHYSYTPYSFIPRIGNKLVDNLYLDMGQGLLECIHEMKEQERR